MCATAAAAPHHPQVAMRPLAKASDRAANMELALCLKVGLMGLFGGAEVAEAFCLLVQRDASLKLVVFGVVRHSHQANQTVNTRLTSILKVYAMRYVTQVGKGIVVRFAVFVIHDTRWPCTSHIKPGKPVRLENLAINKDGQVAMRP